MEKKEVERRTGGHPLELNLDTFAKNAGHC